MSNLLKGGPGIGIEVDPDNVKDYQVKQTDVLNQLYVVAGLKAEPSSKDDWYKVIQEGMDYSDKQCEEYLHALFRLNRDARTAISQLGLLGGATAGVRAAGAAAKEVAITAIAFGLAASSIDTLSSNLLYELEPSSLRTLVRGLQEAFRKNLKPEYDSRPAAVTVLRRYPTNIESEVNLAIKKSQPNVTEGQPNQPPSVTHTITAPTSPPTPPTK